MDDEPEDGVVRVVLEPVLEPDVEPEVELEGEDDVVGSDGRVELLELDWLEVLEP